MYIKNEPKWQKQLIDEISKKYNLDIGVVRQIVYYPLQFVKKRMQSSTNEDPVRIRYMGIWSMRPNKSKEKYAKNNYDYLISKSSLATEMDLIGYEKFDSEDAYLKVINYLYDSKQYSKLYETSYLVKTFIKKLNKKNATKI